MKDINFSIITPCFNSSKTLERTYKSLLNLDYKNFEWILVDDCSIDDGKTKNMKLKFLDKNHFGARSTYEGSLLATGDFACILDHDDQLTSNALTIVRKYIEQFNGPKIAGVAGRCINESGHFIGHPFKKNNFIANEGDVRFRMRMTSEIFQFTKPEILKKYFSDFKPGYTNGTAWAQISTEYNYIFVNDILRIYDTELETSYSNNKRYHISYPTAKAEATQKTLESYHRYLAWNPAYSLRISGSSIRHRLNAGLSIFSDLPRNWPARFFYLASIPLGYVKHLIKQ